MRNRENLKRDQAYSLLLMLGCGDRETTRALDRALSQPGRETQVGETRWKVKWSSQGYKVTS